MQVQTNILFLSCLLLSVECKTAPPKTTDPCVLISWQYLRTSFVSFYFFIIEFLYFRIYLYSKLFYLFFLFYILTPVSRRYTSPVLPYLLLFLPPPKLHSSEQVRPPLGSQQSLAYKLKLDQVPPHCTNAEQGFSPLGIGCKNQFMHMG